MHLRHGAALIRALAAAYHTDWPSKPILIDVSGDASVYGGYTTNAGPAGFAAHSTIAPSGPGAEAEMGLETIFHEASHAVDASIMRTISAECAAQKVRTPRNLWHALIFYTTGELVRRQVGKAGDAHYLPYAYRFDVYSKGMEKDRVALEQDWQPWLDGKVPSARWQSRPRRHEIRKNRRARRDRGDLLGRDCLCDLCDLRGFFLLLLLPVPARGTREPVLRHVADRRAGWRVGRRVQEGACQIDRALEESLDVGREQRAGHRGSALFTAAFNRVAKLDSLYDAIPYLAVRRLARATPDDRPARALPRAGPRLRTVTRSARRTSPPSAGR